MQIWHESLFRLSLGSASIRFDYAYQGGAVRLEGRAVRVLDLGCGPGRDLTIWGVNASDKVIGLDIDEAALAVARERFPTRTFLRGAGELLPFPDETYDRVVCSLALPYMKIEQALAEIHRVLVPDGRLVISFHRPSFTFGELVHHAFPRPAAILFRLYVIANGAWFHCSGRTFGLLRKNESFQTERGMKIPLKRAGFNQFSFSRVHGPTWEMFLVEARKPAFSRPG